MQVHGALLLAGALVCACTCACAAGRDDPGSSHGSEDAPGGAGGTGGSGPLDPGPDGPVCDRWQLEPYLAGADGRLGTSDDELSGGRTVQEVDAANVIERHTVFTSAGGDGAWDTADDEIVSDTRRIAAGPQEVWFVTYQGPGPDGVWGNDDDWVLLASWAKLDASGRPIEERTFNGPGPDGAWMTSDDPVSRRHEYGYGDGQATPKLLDFEFVSPGVDEAWGTGDDPVAVATRRFDEWGTFSSAPGADATWGNDDDDFHGRYEDKRDWEGWLQYLTLFEAGPDTAWFTADDLQTSLATSKCAGDAQDAIDTRLIATAGLDGQWGTADDDVQARMHITGCDDPCGAAQPRSPVEPPK